MPFITSVLAPLHLLAYSTLLGTQLYQSFVMVKIAHRALPYDAFATFQKRVFPVYFRSQTLLVLLTAATFPTHGPVSLVKQKGDYIPLIVAGVTAVINAMYFGPNTSRIMMIKKYQGKSTPLTSTAQIERENVDDVQRRLMRRKRSRVW
jgi:hypothetical protein